MMKTIKQLIFHNIPLKIVSLVGGYLLWVMISGSHVVNVTHHVPVGLYNTTSEQQIEAPETIVVTLQAPRHALYNLDVEELALHVDASRLQKGENHLHVDRSTLFLPEGINVVHYSPSNAVITVH